MDKYREAEPGRPVEVRAFDEHRLGLKPVLRRRWAPEGQRPVAVGRHRYEWLYLYGFVHPGQERAGGLEQVGSRERVAELRHLAAPVDLARLMPTRRQAEVGAHA